MVKPYDYSVDVPDPLQAFGESYALGAKFAESQAKREAAQAEAVIKQQQQQAAIRAQQEVDALYTNPNPLAADFARVSSLLPKDQAENVRKSWEILSDEKKQTKLAQSGQVFSALRANAPDIAIKLLEEQATANRNSGREEEAKAAETYIRIINVDPKRAFDNIGTMLSVVPGGEKIIESAAKSAEMRRAEAMAPAELAAKQRQNVPTAIQEAIDYRNLTPEQQQTFQALQVLKKPPAAVTNVNVTNLEKTASGELAKLLPDLYEQGNSAASQLQDIPRYRKALESAIVGPLADTRFGAARFANLFGFTGDNKIVATRELIQGLSEMALKSRASLTGQGQITEGEQKLLIKARSGDIDFTKGEMETIFNVADRAARSQYEKSRKLLKSAAGKSETAAMFLENMSELPQETAPTPKTQPAQAVQAAGGFTVTAPNGQTFTFPTKQAADQFKQAAGIR